MKGFAIAMIALLSIGLGGLIMRDLLGGRSQYPALRSALYVVVPIEIGALAIVALKSNNP